MSAISLNNVMAVIPLRKPREKLWAKKTCERGKEDQIADVLTKFGEVDSRKRNLSSRHGARDKKETDIRPTISCLKGFARESPGTYMCVHIDFKF